MFLVTILIPCMNSLIMNAIDIKIIQYCNDFKYK